MAVLPPRLRFRAVLSAAEPAGSLSVTHLEAPQHAAATAHDPRQAGTHRRPGLGLPRCRPTGGEKIGHFRPFAPPSPRGPPNKQGWWVQRTVLRGWRAARRPTARSPAPPRPRTPGPESHAGPPTAVPSALVWATGQTEALCSLATDRSLRHPISCRRILLKPQGRAPRRPKGTGALHGASRD